MIFNVKGKDLMAIHSPNDFKDDNEGEKEKVYQEYNDLGLNTEPFKKVKYFIPYSSNSSAKQSTYLPKEDIEEYIREGNSRSLSIHMRMIKKVWKCCLQM